MATEDRTHSCACAQPSPLFVTDSPTPARPKRRVFLRIVRRKQKNLSAPPSVSIPEPVAPPWTTEYYQALVQEAMRAYQTYDQALASVMKRARKTPDVGAPPAFWSAGAAYEIQGVLSHALDVAHKSYGLFYSGLYALAHMAATFEVEEVEHA